MLPWRPFQSERVKKITGWLRYRLHAIPGAVGGGKGFGGLVMEHDICDDSRCSFLVGFATAQQEKFFYIHAVPKYGYVQG